VSQRSALRQDYPRVVVAKCGCGRFLAEIYGNEYGPVCWSGPDGTNLGGGGGPGGFDAVPGDGEYARRRCREGHDIRARGEKLRAAFERVADLPNKRERVIVLPNDL
jgi:hypothetical protein